MSSSSSPSYPFIENSIGQTPLVALRHLGRAHGNCILAKLEGHNPAGSVKDRAAYNMIRSAQDAGQIQAGDTLIEATSGNTGIALAMVAAIMGYRMILVMPDDLSKERAQTMQVYGAQLHLTPAHLGGIEYARDVASTMCAQGLGVSLGQFSNPNNPLAHYHGTAPEIWAQTQGRITHFISSMGTTGTIVGCSRFFKEKNPDIKIIGVQPAEGAKIPGIRRWAEGYVPEIYTNQYIDEIRLVDQNTAEENARMLAKKEGIFGGISAGGALHIALHVAQEAHDAHIVYIVCDRGDRYLSTGVYDKNGQ